MIAVFEFLLYFITCLGNQIYLPCIFSVYMVTSANSSSTAMPPSQPLPLHKNSRRHPFSGYNLIPGTVSSHPTPDQWLCLCSDALYLHKNC